jgi:hypothetical protein
MTSVDEQGRSVVITDIRLPFWSIVRLMVKLSFAAIPAVLIVAAIWFGGGALFAATLAGINTAMQAVKESRESPPPAAPPPAVTTPMPSGPTESEKRCTAAGGDYDRCIQAERRCMGSYERDKCMAESGFPSKTGNPSGGGGGNKPPAKN